MEAEKRRYMEFMREIKAAFEAGKITKEEAEKKLVAVRKKMFKEKSGDKPGGGELDARRRKYDLVTKRIKAAIERGDLSAEDGKKKLIVLRKEIFGGGD